jgi:MerR family mercuric resistance operon transcriptional regulator
MARHEKLLTIGQLAKTAGVNVETIRFYQRKGLMLKPDRPLGGIRRYGQRDLAQVKFIKSAQRLGFSLVEIGQLLLLDHGMRCSAAAQVASRHMVDVRAAAGSRSNRSGALGAAQTLRSPSWESGLSTHRRTARRRWLPTAYGSIAVVTVSNAAVNLRA